MARSANRALKRAARMIRKMQVPAYCAVFEGVQEVENNGVLVEVKKVICIMDIGMVAELDFEEGAEEEDMSMMSA